MDDLLRLYEDPMFVWFPVGGTAVSMISFLAFALPLTWVAAKNPAWAEPFRIQTRKVGARPVVWPSVRLWLLNNSLQFVLVLITWPLTRLSGVHAGPLPPWYEVVWQLLLFVYLDDFLYYWMHRAFHSPWLYRHIHGLHHRISTPWAITGHYMHPLEFIATAGLMLVGPLLLGSHVVTLYLWIILRQWEAAEGHCGYDFPWSPGKLIPGSHGAAHHDFHHSRFVGNYAGFLPLHDKLFHTFARGYAEYRNKKAS
jgi:4-alpha-methyl-delta7-sterol-4alpha-methyl oxidase